MISNSRNDLNYYINTEDLENIQYDPISYINRQLRVINELPEFLIDEEELKMLDITEKEKLMKEKQVKALELLQQKIYAENEILKKKTIKTVTIAASDYLNTNNELTTLKKSIESFLPKLANTSVNNDAVEQLYKYKIKRDELMSKRILLTEKYNILKDVKANYLSLSGLDARIKNLLLQISLDSFSGLQFIKQDNDLTQNNGNSGLIAKNDKEKYEFLIEIIKNMYKLSKESDELEIKLRSINMELPIEIKNLKNGSLEKLERIIIQFLETDPNFIEILNDKQLMIVFDFLLNWNEIINKNFKTVEDKLVKRDLNDSFLCNRTKYYNIMNIYFQNVFNAIWHFYVRNIKKSLLVISEVTPSMILTASNPKTLQLQYSGNVYEWHFARAMVFYTFCVIQYLQSIGLLSDINNNKVKFFKQEFYPLFIPENEINDLPEFNVDLLDEKLNEYSIKNEENSKLTSSEIILCKQYKSILNRNNEKYLKSVVEVMKKNSGKLIVELIYNNFIQVIKNKCEKILNIQAGKYEWYILMQVCSNTICEYDWDQLRKHLRMVSIPIEYSKLYSLTYLQIIRNDKENMINQYQLQQNKDTKNLLLTSIIDSIGEVIKSVFHTDILEYFTIKKRSITLTNIDQILMTNGNNVVNPQGIFSKFKNIAPTKVDQTIWTGKYYNKYLTSMFLQTYQNMPEILKALRIFSEVVCNGIYNNCKDDEIYQETVFKTTKFEIFSEIKKDSCYHKTISDFLKETKPSLQKSPIYQNKLKLKLFYFDIAVKLIENLVDFDKENNVCTYKSNLKYPLTSLQELDEEELKSANDTYRILVKGYSIYPYFNIIFIILQSIFCDGTFNKIRQLIEKIETDGENIPNFLEWSQKVETLYTEFQELLKTAGTLRSKIVI